MRHLLRALARQPDPLSDAALLARYAADRDPAAFEVLVWRHGGLVLGVCRRHVRDTHLAEDAFQATFLILSRQASRVRGETLPGFLHRVARRVAGRAARKHHRRRETPLAVDPAARPSADPELAAVLDAEIDRLPDRLRQVVVLCYLNGASTEAAAARLNIPRGTVLSRLHTARAKLRDRLTRRGVTPPAVGLTLVLTAEQVAGGVRAAGGGVGAATILANEVLTMSVRKLVWGVAATLVLVGGAGTGVGVLNAQSEGSPKAEPAPQQSYTAKLRAAEGRVEVMLKDRQQKAAEERTKPEFVDPAALRAAIVSVGEQILNAEYVLRKAESRAVEAERKLAEVESRKSADPQAVEKWLQDRDESGALHTRVVRAERALADYKLTPQPEAEGIVKLEAQIAAAQKSYRQSAERLRKKAEAVVQANDLDRAKQAMREAKSSVDNQRARLAESTARRDELTKRLAAQTATAGEDELDALRDLRRELARRRLSAELDLPPDPATAAILARLAAVEARLAEAKK